MNDIVRLSNSFIYDKPSGNIVDFEEEIKNVIILYIQDTKGIYFDLEHDNAKATGYHIRQANYKALEPLIPKSRGDLDALRRFNALLEMVLGGSCAAPALTETILTKIPGKHIHGILDDMYRDLFIGVFNKYRQDIRNSWLLVKNTD